MVPARSSTCTMKKTQSDHASEARADRSQPEPRGTGDRFLPHRLIDDKRLVSKSGPSDSKMSLVVKKTQNGLYEATATPPT
jgi:hypothetical protein